MANSDAGPSHSTSQSQTFLPLTQMTSEDRRNAVRQVKLLKTQLDERNFSPNTIASDENHRLLFRDLPACYAASTTTEEAMTLAKDLIEVILAILPAYFGSNPSKNNIKPNWIFQSNWEEHGKALEKLLYAIAGGISDYFLSFELNKATAADIDAAQLPFVKMLFNSCAKVVVGEGYEKLAPYVRREFLSLIHKASSGCKRGKSRVLSEGFGYKAMEKLIGQSDDQIILDISMQLLWKRFVRDQKKNKAEHEAAKLGIFTKKYFSQETLEKLHKRWDELPYDMLSLRRNQYSFAEELAKSSPKRVRELTVATLQVAETTLQFQSPSDTGDGSIYVNQRSISASCYIPAKDGKKPLPGLWELPLDIIVSIEFGEPEGRDLDLVSFKIISKAPSSFDNASFQLHTPGTGNRYIVKMMLWVEDLPNLKATLKERYLPALTNKSILSPASASTGSLQAPKTSQPPRMVTQRSTPPEPEGSGLAARAQQLEKTVQGGSSDNSKEEETIAAELEEMAETSMSRKGKKKAETHTKPSSKSGESQAKGKKTSPPIVEIKAKQGPETQIINATEAKQTATLPSASKSAKSDDHIERMSLDDSDLSDVDWGDLPQAETTKVTTTIVEQTVAVQKTVIATETVGTIRAPSAESSRKRAATLDTVEEADEEEDEGPVNVPKRSAKKQRVESVPSTKTQKIVELSDDAEEVSKEALPEKEDASKPANKHDKPRNKQIAKAKKDDKKDEQTSEGARTRRKKGRDSGFEGMPLAIIDSDDEEEEEQRKQPVSDDGNDTDYDIPVKKTARPRPVPSAAVKGKGKTGTAVTTKRKKSAVSVASSTPKKKAVTRSAKGAEGNTSKSSDRESKGGRSTRASSRAPPVVSHSEFAPPPHVVPQASTSFRPVAARAQTQTAPTDSDPIEPEPSVHAYKPKSSKGEHPEKITTLSQLYRSDLEPAAEAVPETTEQPDKKASTEAPPMKLIDKQSTKREEETQQRKQRPVTAADLLQPPPPAHLETMGDKSVDDVLADLLGDSEPERPLPPARSTLVAKQADPLKDYTTLLDEEAGGDAKQAQPFEADDIPNTAGDTNMLDGLHASDFTVEEEQEFQRPSSPGTNTFLSRSEHVSPAFQRVQDPAGIISSPASQSAYDAIAELNRDTAELDVPEEDRDGSDDENPESFAKAVNEWKQGLIVGDKPGHAGRVRQGAATQEVTIIESSEESEESEDDYIPEQTIKKAAVAEREKVTYAVPTEKAAGKAKAVEATIPQRQPRAAVRQANREKSREKSAAASRAEAVHAAPLPPPLIINQPAPAITTRSSRQRKTDQFASELVPEVVIETHTRNAPAQLAPVVPSHGRLRTEPLPLPRDVHMAENEDLEGDTLINEGPAQPKRKMDYAMLDLMKQMNQVILESMHQKMDDYGTMRDGSVEAIVKVVEDGCREAEMKDLQHIKLFKDSNADIHATHAKLLSPLRHMKDALTEERAKVAHDKLLADELADLIQTKVKLGLFSSMPSMEKLKKKRAGKAA